MKDNQKTRSGINFAQPAVIRFPLIVAAAATFILFIHQATAFAGSFLAGDLKTLFVIVLFIEAFFASLVSAVVSMIFGVGGAMALGKSFTIWEGILVVTGSTANQSTTGQAGGLLGFAPSKGAVKL